MNTERGIRERDTHTVQKREKKRQKIANDINLVFSNWKQQLLRRKKEGMKHNVPTHATLYLFNRI